jgi:hypothetical protein
MEDKGHNASGEYVVLHISIPGSPGLLEDIEVYIILRDVVEVVGVGNRRGYCRVSTKCRLATDQTLDATPRWEKYLQHGGGNCRY